MRVIISCLRSKRTTLVLMKYCSTLLGLLGIYLFGVVFMHLQIRMRIVSVLAFATVACGYAMLYQGVKNDKNDMRVWGYVVTAIGAVIMELGTLFIGG